jgi:hypothetical protein
MTEAAARNTGGTGARTAGANAGNWDPREFIEHRVYCPLSDIQDALDRERVHLGASELLLISFDPWSVLRTLTLLSFTSHEAVTAILDELKGAPDPPDPRRVANPMMSGLGSDQEVGTLLDTLSHTAFYGPGSRLWDHLLTMHAENPWRLMAELAPDPNLIVNCLLLARGTSADASATFVRDVITMVNGTANASVHRDAETTRHVDEALNAIAASESPPTSGHADPTQHLLEMAKRVSRSTAAAILRYDQQLAPKLRLVSRQSRSDDPAIRLKEDEIDIAISTGPTLLAVSAFTTRRPLLYQTGSTWRGQYSSTFCDDDGDVPTEIAVPIPAVPGGGTTPNAGVLVLCRQHADEGQYGDYDLAILRNVALRIALIDSAIAIDEASLGVLATAKYAASAEPAGAPGRALEVQAYVGSPSDNPRPLPVDLERALPGAAAVVEFAARVTGSHSATLRLLTLPPQRRSRYVLSRVLAWPLDRLNDEDQDIDVNADDSVNAYVARTGHVVYLPNIRDRASFTPYRGLDATRALQNRSSRSELCAPICADSRLIGTMNLESPVLYGYSMMSNLVEASAQQIGMLVAAIRRNYLREVLSIGSDVQSSAHDLAGLLSKLNMQSAPYAEQLIDDVKAVLESVIGRLEPSADEVGTISSGGSRTVGDLLDKASKDSKVAVTLRPSCSLPVDWDERTERRLYLAFFEILKNCSANGRTDASGIPAVAALKGRLAGQDTVDVHVTHRHLPSQQPNTRVLYRSPVEKEDRLHFGAYTAGAIIRSLGGEITAIPLGNQSLDIVVSIPRGNSHDGP